MKRPYAHKGHQKGFTFIQMMTVLVILGISGAIAAPSFAKVIAKGKVNSLSNELLTLMHAGRMEAIRTRKNAIVCPSGNGTQCSGNDWSTAIMFSDSNGDGQVSSGEKVLRVFKSTQKGVVIRNQISSGSTKVTFRPNGIAQVGTGSSQDVVSFCSPNFPGESKVLKVGTSMARTRVSFTLNASNKEGCL